VNGHGESPAFQAEEEVNLAAMTATEPWMVDVLIVDDDPLVRAGLVMMLGGASDIRVTVKNELSADLSGASTVFYKGDAVVKDARTSGASAVKKSS